MKDFRGSGSGCNKLSLPKAKIMSADGERTWTKGALFRALGIVAIAVVTFIVGYNLGQSRQLKNDATGNVVFSLHYLNILEANNLEKLDRDLRFFIYANVDSQNRSGGLVTNGMDSKDVARAFDIHSQMSTQVVTFTPEQLMTNVSGNS
jgi:hypothetical protein